MFLDIGFIDQNNVNIAVNVGQQIIANVIKHLWKN